MSQRGPYLHIPDRNSSRQTTLGTTLPPPPPPPPTPTNRIHRSPRPSLSSPLTLLLFPPLAFVADFDGADGEDDGHDEQQETADQRGRDRLLLYPVRELVLELGTAAEAGIRVGVHLEQVLAAPQVLHCGRRETRCQTGEWLGCR